MCDVDQRNHLRSNYTPQRQSVKWWHLGSWSGYNQCWPYYQTHLGQDQTFKSHVLRVSSSSIYTLVVWTGTTICEATTHYRGNQECFKPLFVLIFTARTPDERRNPEKCRVHQAVRFQIGSYQPIKIPKTAQVPSWPLVSTLKLLNTFLLQLTRIMSMPNPQT